MERNNEICSIEVGRGTLRLTSIEMRMTYGGWIEGLPTARTNDAMLERAAKRAGERFGRPVYVVPPERSTDDDSSWRFRGQPAEFVPAVECMGLFEGPPTPRAEGDWWTTMLAVVWYQRATDRVIHPDAVARMHDLPWDELAQDFTFDDW
ncbi:hypothetical protein [Actinomadura vinacea]|uniref:hypothetical protein n=1 Tax=Actinomadura vinacea TaxID=115336 RepID=UPI0031CF3E88